MGNNDTEEKGNHLKLEFVTFVVLLMKLALLQRHIFSDFNTIIIKERITQIERMREIIIIGLSNRIRQLDIDTNTPLIAYSCSNKNK